MKKNSALDPRATNPRYHGLFLSDVVRILTLLRHMPPESTDQVRV